MKCTCPHLKCTSPDLKCTSPDPKCTSPDLKCTDFQTSNKLYITAADALASVKNKKKAVNVVRMSEIFLLKNEQKLTEMAFIIPNFLVQNFGENFMKIRTKTAK